MHSGYSPGRSVFPLPDPPFSDRDHWIETTATITTCRYQFAHLNTLTLGLPTTRRFRLTFDYYAHGRVHSGEFEANHAIPQNSRLPVRYNPLNPAQNSLAENSDTSGGARPSLLLFGVAGSVVLSLLWLAFLRGCS